jgi:hypothetical protein
MSNSAMFYVPRGILYRTRTQGSRLWTPRSGAQPVQGAAKGRGLRFYAPLGLAGGLLAVVLAWGADYNPVARTLAEIHGLAKEIGGSDRPRGGPAPVYVFCPEPDGD